MDLVFRGSEGAFEYDFLIAPNADPSRIRMRFDGARALSVNAQGDLLVDGWFTQRRGRMFIRAHRRSVAGSESTATARSRLKPVHTTTRAPW
jgi:hypothetical protein